MLFSLHGCFEDLPFRRCRMKTDHFKRMLGYSLAGIDAESGAISLAQL